MLIIKDNNKIVYDFGYRLQKLRNGRGLTQKEVALRIGVSTNTISKYENNTGTPSLERLVDLAILYNTSLDYIVNHSKRTNIYIDDLPEKQQDFIISNIEHMKKELKNYDKKDD